jgi:hypothetical protein
MDPIAAPTRCFRMFANVGLNLLPVILVIASLLAPCADRYQAMERPCPRACGGLSCVGIPFVLLRMVGPCSGGEVSVSNRIDSLLIPY